MRQIDFYLRAILKETGWTQTDLATRLETTQATVSRWLKGSEPEGHRRDAIVDLYNEVVSDKSDNGGEVVPLKGRVGAGAIVEAIDHGAAEFVEAPADARPNTVAVEVSGDSMFPAYEDGTLLYYSKLLPPHDLLNRRCVVQLADQRIFVKVLRMGSVDDVWTLQSLNPLVADITDVAVEWAAPIDWIKPR